MCYQRDLISVIVPVYNRELVLKHTVKSILNQSYKRIQLILVDDGSIDNTLLACYDYAKKDSRVCVIHQFNKGPAYARNAGMNVVEGKYIMFVDSDDVLHPRCIEIMHECIRKYSSNVVMCEYSVINENFKLNPQIQEFLFDSINILKKGLNLKEETLYCWAKMWKWETIKDIRFKPLSFCEDIMFTVEVFLKSQPSIIYLKGDPLYYYLKKSDSITRNLSDKNLHDSFEAANFILNKTEKECIDLKYSAINYLVNTAFFAYLQANYDKNDKTVRNRALKIIKMYRNCALLNWSSSLKTKLACMISFFSMDVLEKLYKLRKKEFLAK